MAAELTIPEGQLPRLRCIPVERRRDADFVPGAAYRFSVELPSGTRTTGTYLFPDQTSAMLVVGEAVKFFGGTAAAMVDFEWDPRYSDKLRQEGLLPGTDEIGGHSLPPA